jgi:hypothetical protein
MCVSNLLRSNRREWSSVYGRFGENQVKQEQCDDGASMYVGRWLESESCVTLSHQTGGLGCVSGMERRPWTLVSS